MNAPETRLVGLRGALVGELHRIDGERVAIVIVTPNDMRDLFATVDDEAILAAEAAEARVLAGLRQLVESIEAELHELLGSDVEAA